ncbi:MAG: AMMECR1 domain-containing protein [Akkermansiaceae bacterium]|nr:AMMECR1 domain-containing protein [Akkermansiaceae bacterium]
MNDAVQIAVLMPHAPVLVPGCAGERLAEVDSTVVAMRKVARRVMSHQPSALVLVSPHSPRRRRAFGIWTPERHEGSLARFRAPELAVDLPNDSSMVAGLKTAAAECGADLWFIDEDELDHGAVVPLWFLQEAGWSGPTTILSLNDAADGGLEQLGRGIAKAASRRGGVVALIASGDMSHRLQPGAPGGYHPDARRFDETFIRMVAAGDAPGLLEFDRGLRGLAGEDAVDSTVVALAAVGFNMHGHQMLSYEGPFGVGYGVAVLHESGADPMGRIMSDAAELPRVARLAVASALRGAAAECPQPAADAAQRAPVFVTLRTLDGELRGCRGTVTPQRANAVEETWFNARDAAFEDSRFAPLRLDELAKVRFEVCLLHSFEEVRDASRIDPRQHGVIVSASGRRRGLLLPDIKGVDTAAQQIAIARRKGCIDPAEPVRLRCFRVDKYQESRPAPT